MFKQFIPLPFTFFSTQHASHLKHRFFINSMIMQTEREGCNYLQVPAQYRIHNTYTKDSLHNQRDIQWEICNLKLLVHVLPLGENGEYFIAII